MNSTAANPQHSLQNHQPTGGALEPSNDESLASRNPKSSNIHSIGFVRNDIYLELVLMKKKI